MVADADFNGAAFMLVLGLFLGGADGGLIIGVDEMDQLGAGEILGGIVERGAVGGAGVEEPPVDVDQADEVSGVFGDETVLFLAAAERGLGGDARVFDRLFLDGVGDRGGQALEAGLENVIVGPLADAFDGDLLGARAGDEDEGNVELQFAEEVQGFQGIKLGQGEIRQDDVRRGVMQGGKKVGPGLDATVVELDVAGAKFLAMRGGRVEGNPGRTHGKVRIESLPRALWEV
jgi:hypothetical protein